MEMSNIEFCEALGVTDEREKAICALVRKFAARKCRLRTSEVLPELDTSMLYQRAWSPWDSVSDIIIPLEAHFRIRIPLKDLPNFCDERFGTQEPKPSTFGEWMLRTLKAEHRRHRTDDVGERVACIHHAVNRSTHGVDTEPSLGRPLGRSRWGPAGFTRGAGGSVPPEEQAGRR